MWLSWYWIACAIPSAFRAYFYKESPIRANGSVVVDGKVTFNREWSDVMITSNVSYLMGALFCLYMRQYHLAFVSVANCYCSVLYHMNRETAWYNLDSIYAQFQGFLLMWIVYCSSPSVEMFNSRVDSYFYEGFFMQHFTWWSSLLSEYFDDGCKGQGANCTSAQFTALDPIVAESMTCNGSEEIFWIALLAVPMGMVMLESGGENALVNPVTYTSGREDKPQEAVNTSVIDSTTDTNIRSLAAHLDADTTPRNTRRSKSPGRNVDSRGSNSRKVETPVKVYPRIWRSICMCSRVSNPQYELWHPIWHLSGMFGPIFACIFFSTHCEASNVLGSMKTVTSDTLPFLNLLELPLVPTGLLIISILNSLQLNATGIKPPE